MRTDATAIAVTERSLAALALRKEGRTYAEIASELDYAGPSGAYKAVARLLDKAEREGAEEALELELGRLDTMLQALWPQAATGKLGAIDRVLAISDRRARLLGLAVSRTELRTSHGPGGEQCYGVIVLPPEIDE